MVKQLFGGLVAGAGFALAVVVVLAIAHASDLFTVDKDGTTKFAVSDAGKITVGATESYVNLVIQNDGTTPNSKVNITVDVLTVEGIRLESLSLSADVTASGAGGLDTGAEAANTWYYVWIVTNNAGTSTNGILSTSSTSPTLPSGFTKKRRVGAVRNDGSGNFLRFVQEGNYCNYSLGVDSSTLLVGVIVAVDWTTISTGSLVPPTSLRGKFLVGVDAANNTQEAEIRLALRTTGSGAGQGIAGTIRVPAANKRGEAVVIGDIGTDSSGQIDYRLTISAGGAILAGGGTSAHVVGYYDRI